MARASCVHIIVVLAAVSLWVCVSAFAGDLPGDVQGTPATFRVVLDPGHPSEISAGDALLNGVREVEINWKIAAGLRDRLSREPGMEVLLTRDVEKRMMANRDRAEFANKARAAILLRLHCDAGAPAGFAIYYPNAQGTIHGKVGPSREVIARSRLAAHALHAGMAARLRGLLPDKGVLTDRHTAVGAKNGALIGSIYSEVPAVTVEMVCLTRASDARFISSPEGTAAMIEALAEGIKSIRKAKGDT